LTGTKTSNGKAITVDSVEGEYGRFALADGSTISGIKVRKDSFYGSQDWTADDIFNNDVVFDDTIVMMNYSTGDTLATLTKQ
jgi:hypothetical protein